MLGQNLQVSLNKYFGMHQLIDAAKKWLASSSALAYEKPGALG